MMNPLQQGLKLYARHDAAAADQIVMMNPLQQGLKHSDDGVPNTIKADRDDESITTRIET